MFNYLVRRSIYGVILIAAVSLISFFLITLPPGDYMSTMISTMQSRGGISASEAEQIAINMRQAYGLDAPFFVQYWKWIYNIVLKGDFGYSFFYRTPVKDLIMDKVGWTLLVTISALLFSFVVGMIIGIYSATHQYTFADNFFSVISFLGLSLPTFFFAVLVMYIQAVIMDVPDIGGLFSSKYVMAPWSWAKLLDLLQHLWIPVLIVGAAGTARIMRVMRGNLLDVLGTQYVQVARAKGLNENVVIYKHALKNALQPMIMFAGMMLPFLLQGALITSIVLNLPTLGPIFYDAINSQDMYLAGSYMLFIAIFLVLGNILADIALALIDPRVKYD